MRAFVTGATGFVGSAVVRHLLQRDIAVRVLTRRTSNLDTLSNLEVEVFQADLLDEDGLAGTLQDCSLLFHVAAYYSTAEVDAQAMYETNVRGTKTILRAAQRAGVQRVVHTSTIGTIGQPVDGTWATEASDYNLWNTSSHYAKSKYLGEVVALNMCAQGLPVVVVNPCAPVGVRDVKPSSTGQRILDYLCGKQPSFVPGGINFVSVEDVAEGHVLAAEKGRVGERYILGNREGNLRLADFMALMQRVSGLPRPSSARPSTLHWLRSRLRNHKGDFAIGGRGHRPQPLTCDPSKAIRELGLPQTSLERAFADAVAWFKANRHGCVEGVRQGDAAVE